jgi:hypothetical protein
MRMAGGGLFLSARISRRRRVASLLIIALTSLAFVGLSPLAALGAPAITGVEPDCADHGQKASLVGSGLDDRISVSVGGKRAEIVSAADTAITFIVPNAAPSGDTVVIAVLASRGKREEIGRFDFRVASDCPANGVLLEGPSDSPAFDALTLVIPPPVPDDEIVDGLFLTRLNVALLEEATVGQVNDGLQAIGGLIIGMQPGFPNLDISVPRQEDAAGLQQLADALTISPGIALSWTSREPGKRLLPPDPAGLEQNSKHLRTARFPAAWNAKELALENCNPHIQVVVPDYYDATPPQFFGDEISHFSVVNGDPTPGDTHGYDVITTMAAAFNESIPTGANPFSDCVDIRAVRAHGKDWSGLDSLSEAIAAAIPAGQNVILSNSTSFEDICGDPSTSLPCGPALPHFTRPIDRFADAAVMRQKLGSFDGRLLVATSAGNEAADDITEHYAGAGDARFDSPFAVLGGVGLQLSVAQDPLLWNPQEPCPGGTSCFPDMAASPALVNQVQAFINDNGLATAPAPNVSIVGAALASGDATASFSDVNYDVLAVGVGIPTLAESGVEGTSFTSPQVAGLASYMWLLSPTLRQRPVSDTLNAIRANVFHPAEAMVPGLINAYQAVLSLDQAAAVTPSSAPVRLRILDVDNDNDFDMNDVRMYADALRGTSQPEDPSRFDLNGDGNVGGSTSAVFDLDPTGSIQFGTPRIDTDPNPIVQQVGPFTRKFDEKFVTDEDALCYYAWSGLFTHTETVDADLPDPRIEALGDICKWEGMEYRGTITWDHDQMPIDADTFFGTWHVVADITMTIEPDFTLLPTGTITYTGHFESSADGQPPADCLENDNATGEPTDYSGTFVSDVGSLSGSVSGTRTRSGSCTGGTFPITIDFIGQAEATHVFTEGILTTIDFNREVHQEDGPDEFVNDVFTGTLTLQPATE